MAQALVERILHFEGFYFSNTTLDLAVRDPNGFQARRALAPRRCCPLVQP